LWPGSWPPRRLSALGHLDLQIIGIDQVFAGHAEARRGHLLDGAAPRVAVGIEPVAGGVLAALAGVRLAADAVHRNSQGLVRFLADGAIGHGPGREPLDDRLDRLHLFQRNRRAARRRLIRPRRVAGRWLWSSTSLV
jgi:hypothetical protein